MSTTTLERPRPFALRFEEPLVAQEELDEMFAGSEHEIHMTKISPTHTVTGIRYDIEPDDE